MNHQEPGSMGGVESWRFAPVDNGPQSQTAPETGQESRIAHLLRATGGTAMHGVKAAARAVYEATTPFSETHLHSGEQGFSPRTRDLTPDIDPRG